MAEHMWPVPQHMRSLKCPVCKTTEGDRFFCDLCETQFCGFCIYPKHHSCGRKGDPRPATTSKATSPALGAQQVGRASRSTPLPMPPPQRKPLHVLKPGMHPNAWQHDARESAKKNSTAAAAAKSKTCEEANHAGDTAAKTHTDHQAQNLKILSVPFHRPAHHHLVGNRSHAPTSECTRHTRRNTKHH